MDFCKIQTWRFHHHALLRIKLLLAFTPSFSILVNLSFGPLLLSMTMIRCESLFSVACGALGSTFLLSTCCFYSAMKGPRKSLRDLKDFWRIVIKDAVILPPLLLLKNLVQNLFFNTAQESMERGGKLLNHLSVVPLRHVEKERHLST